MTFRLLVATLVVGAALLIAPALAAASPVTFELSNCGEIIGPPGFSCPNNTGRSTLTYQSGGLTMTAYGYLINTLTGTNLYVKQAGAGETGLGITAETDHEISSQYLVDLDVSNLVAHGITHGDLTLQSVQNNPNEHYDICVESVAGHIPTNATCRSGSGGISDTLTLTNIGPWDATNHFIAVTTGGTGDILIASSLVVTPSIRTVPEPGTVALFSTEMIGLALIRRRPRG